MILELLLGYLVLINLASLTMMYWDKRKAVKNRYRISEKSLLMSGALGGIIGMLMGMKMFRHKTRKRSFQLPVVFIIFLNLIYWYLIYLYFLG